MIVFFWGGTAFGQTIALFPLLDLTIDPNGFNPKLTDMLRRETQARGFELVEEQDVMRFMVRHRIRNLGRLTSHEITLAGEELEADLVLQGTVCQLKEELPSTVSLSLQLIRTSDARTVWAHSEGLYYAELLTLLGLSDPKVMNDLYRVFFPRLLADMPLQTSGEKGEEDHLDVESVVLWPDYLRPGETVECKIRLYSLPQDPDNLPHIVARVGDREYPMTLDEEEYYFKTSWPAQERAGEYTVTLFGTWPSGRSVSGVIGTYYVDDLDPGVRLNVIGKEVDGTVAFSRKLVMVPRLINPEPISRCQVEVMNEDGEIIVRQESTEDLPERITWWGQSNQGTVPPDGKYKIIFKVWDRVGRESETEAEVLFLRMAPDIKAEAVNNNGTVSVSLANTVTTPVAFWWMKFFDADGRQVKLAQGESLPASIEVEMPPREEDSEAVLEGLVQVRDVVGNQTTMKIKNLLQKEETEDTENVNIEKEWIEEF